VALAPLLQLLPQKPSGAGGPFRASAVVESIRGHGVYLVSRIHSHKMKTKKKEKEKKRKQN